VVRIDKKEFHDIEGRKRIFEFRGFSVPTGFKYEAVEIQKGEPEGMVFSVLGNTDDVYSLSITGE
jgi:hypothetical protein